MTSSGGHGRIKVIYLWSYALFSKEGQKRDIPLFVILNGIQYDEALDILVRVGEVLKNELASLNLTLIDFKIEVGYDEEGKIYVADEITPDIWRVKDENGNIPNQIDCAKMILAKLQ